MIKKKYNKEYGTNDMYLDAALEALKQAREEDKYERFRTAVLAASDCIHTILGDEQRLVSIEKFVDKMEAFNKALEELTKDIDTEIEED